MKQTAPHYKTQNVNANGTGRQGTLKGCSPRTLKTLFGEPVRLSTPKVTYQWEVEAQDGTVITIYRYKQASPPVGSWDEYDWSIGGRSSQDTCNALRQIFEAENVDASIEPLY